MVNCKIYWMFVLMMIGILIIPVQAVDGGINGSVAYGSMTWNATNFPAFWHEDGIYGETLAVVQSNLSGNQRTIDWGILVYNTTGKLVPYKVYTETGLTVFNGLNGGGYYAKVGWLGKPFVAVNGKANKLSELLVEQNSTDYKELTVGETWDLGEGWTLKAQSIDAKASPRQVWFVLHHNGVKLDDRVIAQGEVYTYVEKSFAGETDVPLFVTYVDSVFAGATSDMVQLRYTWLISKDVTEFHAGDQFGLLEVMTAASNIIELKNKDNYITLTRDATINLFDNLYFVVNDTPSLEYYPMMTGAPYPTTPTVITVDDSGGADYTRIQDAIDNASDGDTILVYSGMYYENVNVTKQLVLRGFIPSPLSNMTVVDAGGSGNAITLSAGNSTVEKFTIVNAGHSKAGIYVSSNNNIIKNNTVNLNSYAGIYIKLSSNNTLSNNSALNNYYGIFLDSSSNNNLSGNIITSCDNGIFLGSLSGSFSSYNILRDNTITNSGSRALSIFDSNNIIYNNFFNNTNNWGVGSTSLNTWNISKTAGMNIIGDSYIGGNVWANPSGIGFSQICPDIDSDGICDSPHVINSNNTDYLALAYPPAIPDTTPPVLTFTNQTPANESTINQKWAIIEITSNELLNSILLEWNGINESITGSKRKISLPNGTYTFRVWGTDYFGNWNSTEIRVINISAPETDFVVEGGSGTGSVADGPMIWNATNFPAFWHEDGIYGETLAVVQSDLSDTKRTIYEGNLTYSTERQVVPYKVYTEAGLTVKDGVEYGGEKGYYAKVGWLGKPYVALKGDAKKLSEIVLEQDSTDYKELTVGETWDMGEGWTLKAQSVDINAYPRQVWLVLSKDGVKMEDEVVSQGEVFTYRKDIAGKSDAPLFVTYVENITSDSIRLRYTWLISDDIYEFQSGDHFGILEVVSAGQDKVELKNKDYSITLSMDSTISLFDNLYLVVNDIPSLEYYPMMTGAPEPTPTPREITVDDSGGANYTRIQDAIDNASDGDTILVYSGTYFENVDVTKQLVLRGIDDGSGKPVVDATGSGNAVILSGGNTTLQGFNVVNSSFGGAGIRVKSNNNMIENNTANSNNYYGIYLFYPSNNNTLIRNNASNNRHGIYLGSSSNNTLTNNVMTGNEYNFGGYDSRTGNEIDTSNLVNGKPIYYIKNATNTVYDPLLNAGTFYCLNCDNVTLKDLNLNKNGAGIFFWNTTNSTIQNVNVSDNYMGIYLRYSNNNTIIENNASSNIAGIELDNSNNNTLKINNAMNGIKGIYLVSSKGNILNSNYAPYNTEGLSMYYSSNNTISGNNFSYNYDGIRMYGNDPNNVLFDNIVSHNIQYGIVLLESPHNTIYNNFFNNTNNFVSSSIFIKSTNEWNITKILGTNIIGGPYLAGNFWANSSGTGFSQTCTDADGDGICDLPYTLDSNNTDYLPLILDTTPPAAMITQPGDRAYLSKDVLINGTANDTNFNRYIVEWKNNTVDWQEINYSTTAVSDGKLATWNTTTILDGNYNLSLVVTDNASNTNTSTINVTIDNTLPQVNITEPAENATVRFVDNIVKGEVSDQNFYYAELVVRDGTDSIVSSYNLSIIEGKFTQRVEYAPEQDNTLELIATDKVGNSNSTLVNVSVLNNTVYEKVEVEQNNETIIDATNETDVQLVVNANISTSINVTITAITNVTQLNNVSNSSSVFGESALGKIVEIHVDGIDASNALEVNYVTVRMYYTKNDLDLDGDGTVEVGELNEEDLFIYWYDSDNGTWIKLEIDNPNWVDSVGRVDTGDYSGYMWAKIHHLSKFAMAAGQVPDSPDNDNVVTSSGGGGGGGGGVSSSEPFENILKAERYERNLIANMPVSYTFLEHEHSIYEILVTAKENENYIALRCEVLKGTSKLVKAEPPGIVYINENIWLGTKRVKESLIKFKVENSWLDENNIVPHNIKMLRYDGSQWTQLDTTEKTKDSNYTYYEAITPGFSPFAITGFKEETIPTPEATITGPEPTPEITITEIEPEVKPPVNWALILGVIFVISLIVVVYLRKKWMSR